MATEYRAPVATGPGVPQAGLPFDHPIWQNLPPCTCGTVAAPYQPTIRYQDFGVRVQPEPVIVAPQLPPARGKRAKRKRYEAPVR